MARRYDIAVVGAGLAGLAAVLRLRDAGLSVALIDNVAKLDGDRMNWGHDLQPGALLALESLGLLEDVERLGARHERYCLERLGGGRLSTWEYAMLDHPHPYAVCIRTHVLRQLLRERAAACDHVETYIPATFKGLERQGDGGLVVDVEREGTSDRIEARLVVGADGPRSVFRGAAGIGATFRRGKHHWLDVIMRDEHGDVPEGYVYFGRGDYVGIVPTRPGELVAFHLTPADSADAYRAQFGGVEQLRRAYAAKAPVLARPLETLEGWERTSFTPGHSMRAERWVDDGVALVGDSAVTVNPITSEGAALAIEGGIGFAEVAIDCFRRGDLSAAALGAYEQRHRRPAEQMQEMGDLFTRAFSSRNPVAWRLLQRVLTGIDRRPEMKHRVLAYFAGIHPERIGILDGLAGAGLWPSRRRRLALSRPRSA